MPRFGELMDRLTVTVRSPDGKIVGHLANRTHVRIEFLADSYYEYDRQSLERQLASLGKLLWVGRRRGSLRALSEVVGYEVTGREERVSDDSKEYDQRLRELELGGQSIDGHIRILCTGWQDWAFEIEDDALEELSEGQFLSELDSAVRDLLTDNAEQVSALKAEIFMRRR